MNNKIKICIVAFLLISAALIQSTSAMSNSDYSQLITLITSFINEQKALNQQVQDMNNTINGMNATINKICSNNASLCYDIVPTPTPTPTPNLGGYWQMVAQYNFDGDDHYIADRAMISFHNRLYAGTMNDAGTGGRLLVYNENNNTWSAVSPYAGTIHTLTIHNDTLFASGSGAKLLKWNENNDTFTIMANAITPNPPDGLYTIISHNGTIFGSTNAQTGYHDGELWIWNQNNNTWSIVAYKLGINRISGVDMAEFKGQLFLAPNLQGQLLRWNSATNAYDVMAPIYASTDYTIHAMKVYNNELYVTTGSETAVNSHGYLLKWDEPNLRYVLAAGQYDSETQINTLDIRNGKLRGTGWRSWKSLEWDGVNSWIPMTTLPPSQEQSHENGGGMTPYASTVHNGNLYTGSYGTGNLYKWVPN